jgi:DNA polymerase III subunit epsilon
VLLDTLVRPSDLIPPDASLIHGIDDPAVADAPTWDAVYPLVGRILDSYGPVVVYNADFDQRVIRQTNALYGLPDFEAAWQCAMKQHASYVGIWHDIHQNWRWHKLVEAMRMMGREIPAVQHRALADAESCRQVVEAMAAGVEPVLEYPSRVPAVVETRDQHDREQPLRGEPLQPEIIQPGEERREEEIGPGWKKRSGEFPGGRFTVISTRSEGCSSGALLLTLVIGVILIGLCCCAFFYLGMVFA